MTNVGYATLQIIPSMEGFTPNLARGLAPQLSKAGLTAGREMGKGITTGAQESAKTTGLFTNVEKGAEVAGVGAGRRFGTALRETVGEYGKTIGASMVGFFAFEKVKELVSGIIEQGQAAARSQRITEAIIASTGEAAHVTAAHVDELSNAMSRKTGIDKESIASAENILLTFRGVRNEVGKGNDIFDQASKSILDISTVLAGSGGSDGSNSFSGAARQVGRALQDPVHGLTALTRAGVIFTTQQKAQIKALVEGGDANAAMAMGLIDTTTTYNNLLKQNGGNAAKVAAILEQDLTPAQKKMFEMYSQGGHTLEAQKMVLKELQTEYGGAAAASGDAVSKMTASFHVWEAEVGQKVLPLVNNLANGVSYHLMPAVQGVVQYVGQVGTGFSNLDPVLKTVTAGMVAFAVASKAGWVASTLTALSELRLNIDLVALEYETARESQGRFTSGLAALKLGASLTNSATRRTAAGIAGVGLSMSGLTSSSNKAVSALSSVASGALLGYSVAGPFGAAIGGVFGALKSLATMGGPVSDSQKSIAASVQSVVDTLNQETGALTGSSRAAAEKSLVDAGVFDAAKKLHVNLGDLVNAYLDVDGAAQKVSQQVNTSWTSAMHKGRDAMNGVGNSVNIVMGAIGKGSSTLEEQRHKIILVAEANRALKQSNQDTGGSFQTYADKINAAKKAIYGLVDAENKQRLVALKNAENRLSLAQAMTATADAAKHAKKGLDENTKAGQDNLSALYALADQWNGLPSKITNARGEYWKVRNEFVKDAEQMGATKKAAKQMADQFLQVPKRVATQVDTPGMADALANLANLKDAAAKDAALRATVAVYVSKHQANDPRLKGNNAAGTDFWRGGPTWVGEAGAELINLPTGTQITPHNKATAATAGGPQRVTLDFGGGRTLTGWIQDEVANHAVFRRTTGSRL